MVELSPKELSAYWRAGELDHKLHKGQLVIELCYLKAIDSGKLFVADCSRQLGKTTWGVKKSIETAIKKPNSKIRIGTAYLTDLEQFVRPAFELILQDIPADMRPIWMQRTYQYIFPHPINSTVGLVGLDRKPNGLRGNRLDMVILDECRDIANLGYIYRSVLIPATTHVDDAKIIMLSTQPDSPDHEFVSFCDLAALREAYVKLDVFKNPMLLQEQIEELAGECGGYDSTEFRREYLCERIVEESRSLVPEFRVQHHVMDSPRCDAFKYWIRLCSLDSGVRDKTAAIFAYYDFARAKLVIEDCFTLQGHEVTTRRIATELTEREQCLEYFDKPRRVADNDNLILLQDLGSEYGFHFTATGKDELPAMVNQMRLWFAQNRIEINPRCTELISCLQAGIWNKMRRDFDRSKVHGHYDLIASLMYLIRNVPEFENPLPAFFGEDLSNVIYQPRSLKARMSNAEKLKKAFGEINQ